jgi:hypothetical protein
MKSSIGRPSSSAMDCATRRCSMVALSWLILVRDALTRSPSDLARPYCSGTRLNLKANFVKPGYHLIGSRVETGRFEAMEQLDSVLVQRTAPPYFSFRSALFSSMASLRR